MWFDFIQFYVNKTDYQVIKVLIGLIWLNFVNVNKVIVSTFFTKKSV